MGSVACAGRRAMKCQAYVGGVPVSLLKDLVCVSRLTRLGQIYALSMGISHVKLDEVKKSGLG